MIKFFRVILSVLLLIVTTTVTIEAKNIYVGVGAGYFAPVDSSFTDIYGSGEATFGVNAAYRFFKFFSLQAAYDLFKTKGETPIPIPGLDLDVSLNTLRIGGYFSLNLHGIIPRAGGGLAVSMVNGESPYGSIKKTKTGWFVGTGVDIRVYKNFIIGPEVLYHDVVLKENFGTVSVGGMSYLLHLKIEI